MRRLTLVARSTLLATLVAGALITTVPAVAAPAPPGPGVAWLLAAGDVDVDRDRKSVV